MEIIKINQIKFYSFIKLSCVTALPFGIAFGLSIFILSILGGNVETNLGPVDLEGVAGGIAAIIVGPLIFVIFGLILGFIGYFPFKLMLKVFRGITLHVQLDTSPTFDDLNKE